MELAEGILLIDKPAGMTSFDVIRRLRRSYLSASNAQTGGAAHGGAKAPKLGHAGTLDPLATGLMVLGVGKGTKELAKLVKHDKEYIAEILIGERRTTGDMEGEVMESRKVAEISQSEISATLKSMVGTLTLPVSAYSAIKKDGVPMYKRARKAALSGQSLDDSELPIRDMIVYEAEFLGSNLTIINDSERQIIKVRFRVASGVYIRSLAEEFGRRLPNLDCTPFGHSSHKFEECHQRPCEVPPALLTPPPSYPACLYSLRRTKVGEFNIKDANQLDKFT